jgi:hypothetical protein
MTRPKPRWDLRAPAPISLGRAGGTLVPVGPGVGTGLCPCPPASRCGCPSRYETDTEVSPYRVSGECSEAGPYRTYTEVSPYQIGAEGVEAGPYQTDTEVSLYYRC